jgi:hypothetical protein
MAKQRTLTMAGYKEVVGLVDLFRTTGDGLRSEKEWTVVALMNLGMAGYGGSSGGRCWSDRGSRSPVTTE